MVCKLHTFHSPNASGIATLVWQPPLPKKHPKLKEDYEVVAQYDLSSGFLGFISLLTESNKLMKQTNPENGLEKNRQDLDKEKKKNFNRKKNHFQLSCLYLIIQCKKVPLFYKIRYVSKLSWLIEPEDSRRLCWICSFILWTHFTRRFKGLYCLFWINCMPREKIC